MANDAKFNFYLNRQGPKGQTGEKGDQGFSPSITVNTNTADEYTLLIQNEYDSFVTDNIRPTYDDRGGTYVRVDRANNVQYFGSADVATTANYGEVKLAQASDLASTVDVGNSNVITVELLKTWFDGQLADNLVTTTNNVTIQGQKIFATPTRFMDTVRIGNRLMVTQDDTGTITFDSDETGTVIGNNLTSTGDARFNKNVSVDGIATIEGGLNVAGNAVISSPQLGNTTVSGGLTTKAGINIQGQDIHLQDTNPTMYLKNIYGVNEIEIFRGLFSDGNPSPAANYLRIGNSQLNLNLSGKAIKANGKDVATADTVEAIQTDLNIAKQDIIEAQGDIDNLQMNKQNKLTAGTGITIDADNVISATGGVVDIPIASSTTLGGIKVGENLTISEDGTLSATGGSGTSIDDSTTSSTSTWSSSKINSEINTVANEVVQVQGDVAGLSGDVTTLSGKVTAVEGKTTDLESAVANKQNKLTAGAGIAIDQTANTISSTTPITYLTRAQYDALETKDANTMYVITDEEGGGGSSVTYTAEAPLSISADNVISIDTTGLGGTTLKKDASMNVDYALDLTANGTVGGTSKAARAESNESKHDAYMAFSGHNPSDAISTLWGPNKKKTGSWVELYLPDGVVPYSAAWTYGSTGEILPAVELLASNDGSSYTSLGSVTGVSTVTASMTFNTTDSYKYLRFKFRDACVTSAWGKFGLTSLKVKSSEVTTYTELFIGDNIDVTNGTMNVNLDEIGSELSDLSTRVTTIEDTPILDVPVNNCVLAMPTAPTFDGTNVTVYTGTKVAIANGLNADGTCKSNIVTLTTDATINQSTFNGDVTLMLKSDGTIDQTVYSYFEVDDISTITTLTAYCWYYDRKTNNHYLASSTGAKQGPYQRIKIGSYNQAEAATTKYFKTYKPIALEKLDITGSCMPDYSAGKDVSAETIHTATVDGYVFAQASSRSGGNGGHVDIYDKNGTLIKSWNYVGAEATATYSYSAFQCPIPKGYSYKVYGGVDIVIQFYPAKGTEV